LVGCDIYDGCKAQIATNQAIDCDADLRNPGLGRLRRLRWLRYLTSQPPKHTKSQLRSFLSQAPISLSLDNQTSSAGVAPNKKKECVFSMNILNISLQLHILMVLTIVLPRTTASL
jgi:hypothetical protein